MIEKTFKTKDLYFASVLYAEQVHLLGAKTEGAVCWFEFETPILCYEKYNDYISRNLMVNAKSFEEAIRTLKGIIFQQKGGV